MCHREKKFIEKHSSGPVCCLIQTQYPTQPQYKPIASSVQARGSPGLRRGAPEVDAFGSGPGPLKFHFAGNLGTPFPPPPKELPLRPPPPSQAPPPLKGASDQHLFSGGEGIAPQPRSRLPFQCIAGGGASPPYLRPPPTPVPKTPSPDPTPAPQALVEHEVGVHVGLACGVVFCGIIGSQVACRWDITGPACVRSCRLMQHAVAHDIAVVVDVSVFESVSNVSLLQPLGTGGIALKGSSVLVPIYTLADYINPSTGRIVSAHLFCSAVHQVRLRVRGPALMPRGSNAWQPPVPSGQGMYWNG